MKTEIKVNDVFNAHWKDSTKSNHCFEGLLVAMEATVEATEKTEIILVDKFWDGGGNKWFTLTEAEAQLILTYKGNLDDYDLVNVKTAPKYYDDEDFIFMHSQHACSESCKYYYLKKGAKKSATKMTEMLREKIRKSLGEIRVASSQIERSNEDIQRIENGELENIWI